MKSYYRRNPDFYFIQYQNETVVEALINSPTAFKTLEDAIAYGKLLEPVESFNVLDDERNLIYTVKNGGN
ncbi:MAG TPA: hypothetical protein PKI14_01550 [Fervidobacterium sp.]|nr:hypothetical protein [Fervidobacterium sp.]